MNETIRLNLSPVTFYSQGDEQNLLRALQDNPFVSDLQYIDAGHSFLVDIATIDWEGFKDLVALYIRYKGDLNDLLTVCPAGEATKCFLDPRRGWHGQLC